MDSRVLYLTMAADMSKYIKACQLRAVYGLSQMVLSHLTFLDIWFHHTRYVWRIPGQVLCC